ncbi:MAG TPA: Pr6Pr family membrane protein [Propionibacteriaceae bacterium]
MTRAGVARLCFAATCVIAAFSLSLQLVQDLLGVWDDPGTIEPSAGVTVWRFFSYFTTQSNLLVVATCLGLARQIGRDGSGWRVARLDALAGITITGLVHWFLLHPLDDFHGWLWASDTLVHIVVPVLAVAGWVAFGPRRRITLRTVLLGLIWPLAWLFYTLVVGGITGFYPYFFLDVGEIGAGSVALYCAAILVLLFVVSCLFWLGDRWLPGRIPARPARAARR